MMPRNWGCSLVLVFAALAAMALASGPRPGFFYVWSITGKHAPEVSLEGTPIRTNALMLYQHEFGKYPRLYKGKPIFGGVPQNCDIQAHLDQLRLDIDRLIPDRQWAGYAVIDYEGWDPLWRFANDEIKQFSITLAQQRHPTRSREQVERLAKASFESAARTYLEKTFELCKQMRPHARWGLYGAPWEHQDLSDGALDWLWRISTALYPNAYMVYKGSPQRDHAKGLGLIEEYQAIIEARMKLSRKIVGPDVPVVPLIWVRYHEMNPVFGGQFLDPADLRVMLRLPIELGADGAMFWDALNDPKLAADYRAYLDRTLAAEVRLALRDSPPK